MYLLRYIRQSLLYFCCTCHSIIRTSGSIRYGHTKRKLPEEWANSNVFNREDVFMKMKKLLLLATLGLFVLSPAAEACSSIAVGKGASASGAYLCARREDLFSSAGKRLAVYPAGKYAKGEKLRSTKSDYFYTMSHDSYKHTGVPRMTPAPDGQDVHIAFGTNEYGLAVIAGWPRRFPTISSSSWRTTW